jgi:hypothetical protein
MLHRLLVISFICLCSVLLVATTTNAQIEGQPYRLSDKDVEKIIKRIEQQSDHFRSSLDSALDKSRLDGTNREDDINSFVKDFYQETKRLRDHFDSHKSSSPDVELVLQRAARIDDFTGRYPLSSRAQQDWSTLKSYLDELAAAYNVSWRWTGYRGNEGNRAVVDYPRGAAVGVPSRVSDREVENVLRKVEQQSDRFKSALDSSLDKSRLDGTREEDNINKFVKDFYEQTKNLRNRFDDHKSTSGDMQSVLDRAARIDEFIRRNPLRRSDAAREWSRLRSNLDELANIYNVTWQWRN